MFRKYLNDCFVSFAAVTCVKMLFIPLYRSTDFEVHRNWMAITHQKELKEWYTDRTSQWTLDYPPLFAWFEYLLSTLANYFDSKMLQVTNLNYESLQTIFFMRLSVIVSDVIYYYGVNRFYNLVRGDKMEAKDPWLSKEVILAMLFLWNPGLLIVDHIHFQYNGFLNGILFMSFADMLEKKYVLSAFWFSILINLKHIYLYLAPAYFLFLLKNYCFRSKGKISMDTFSVTNFSKLAVVGIGTMLLSFGPFIYMGQLNQVLSRLFPVKRGLTHSYWAPNFWALYNFLDRILSRLAISMNIYAQEDLLSCSTRGLVQECEHNILPTVSSQITFILALVAMAPMFYLIWKKQGDFKVFLDSIVLCSFGSFMFGYHVHEKAVLLIILPLTISAVLCKEDAKLYSFLSTVGHFSLFPLLNQQGETFLKIGLLLLHMVYMFSSLRELHRIRTGLLSTAETFYLWGLVALQAFYSFGAKAWSIEKKFPFLPLMLISTYCAIGIFYSWVKFCTLTTKNIYVWSKVLKKN